MNNSSRGGGEGRRPFVPACAARDFRARFGYSIGAFVRARRIDAVRDALRNAARPIAAIALDAGFYDQSHLTNVFRRLTGMTPKNMRAEAVRDAVIFQDKAPSPFLRSRHEQSDRVLLALSTVVAAPPKRTFREEIEAQYAKLARRTRAKTSPRSWR